jgi:hypothetical protein
MNVICEVCGSEIGHGHATVHKVVGWVEVKNGKAVGNVIQPSGALGYAHKVCISTRKGNSPDTPMLF